MTATGGTYTLILEVPEQITIGVRALGETTFTAGWYAYVGSATGPGGFSRVDRHREVAAGNNETRHWHIDYLLGHDQTTLETVVTSAETDAECAVASDISERPVPAFGCSDCDCHSHLFAATDRQRLLAAVDSAHESVADGSL